jgi:ketosteroid isomerase-like protein
MKRLDAVMWSALVFLSVLASPAVVAASPAAEIRGVLAAQVAAWNRGDIDGFMEGYARSDKTEFVSGGKATRGWQTVRDRYHKRYSDREKMGRLAFSDIKTNSMNDTTAVVTGRWELARKHDKPHGSFTLLFRRTAAGWRIVHDETSTAHMP